MRFYQSFMRFYKSFVRSIRVVWDSITVLWDSIRVLWDSIKVLWDSMKVLSDFINAIFFINVFFSKIWSNFCEIPSNFTRLYVSDSVTFWIGDIKWNSWNAEGASGEGTYQINDCLPNCAEGKQHYGDVLIELSKSKTINGKPTLTYIKVTTKDGKNLPLSDSPTDAWPMELAG